jgi:hypothetical protein
MHDVIIAFCLLLLSTVRTKRFGICVGLFYPASKKLHKLHTESSSDFMLHFSSDGGILSEYEQLEFERFVTELKLRAIHFNTCAMRTLALFASLHGRTRNRCI